MAAIRKLKSGKFEVQVRRKGFAPISRTFHKRADAEEWARHTEIRADRRDLPTQAKTLDTYKVRDILTEYRDKVVVEKRGASAETYLLNAFLRHPIANLTLAQITPAHFSTYRISRLKQVKPVSVNRELGIIKHAFDVAMREWDIPMKENPLAKLKKLKVNNARNRRIEPAELEAIHTAITTSRNPFLMPLIRLAIESAMRRGELLALQWQHIDFENRTAFIPVTKNGYSRTIPLTSEAIKILDIEFPKGSRTVIIKSIKKYKT